MHHIQHLAATLRTLALGPVMQGHIGCFGMWFYWGVTCPPSLGECHTLVNSLGISYPGCKLCSLMHWAHVVISRGKCLIHSGFVLLFSLLLCFLPSEPGCYLFPNLLLSKAIIIVTLPSLITLRREHSELSWEFSGAQSTVDLLLGQTTVFCRVFTTTQAVPLKS